MTAFKNKFKKRDEYYTPPILVKPILEYIDKEKIIWCPFDTDKSEFVKLLKQNGNKVICSHIWNGQDFFNYKPTKYDYIISNPPFTLKIEVFKRLFELDKPFAMLMNLEVLNYQVIGEFFYNIDRQLQLLIVDKKVSYDGKTAMFNTSYFCYKMLPNDLVFTHLEHNNSGDRCIKSEMYEELKERSE